MDNSLEIRFWPLVPCLQEGADRIPLAIEMPVGEDSFSAFSFTLQIENLGRVIDCLEGEPIRSLSQTTGFLRFEQEITLTKPLKTGSGYGLYLTITFPDGSNTEAKSAIDVEPNQVRYGFLTGFKTEDSVSRNSALDFLLQQHCTHVQFYDWSYRPHQYEIEPIQFDQGKKYRDLMGKSVDLSVVKQSVEGLQHHGMKALAYGAVYAASKEYLQDHPEQGLYAFGGKPIDLIDKFFIMNIAEGNQWRKRILDQYCYATDTLGFDGIHMDTYGYPKIAFDNEQKPVYLDREFVSLINAWAKHGNENIFNNVGGWPADLTAKANQKAVYIEVWDPHTQYRHLRQLIQNHRGFGKPVVLAAYSRSFKESGTLDRKKALASTCLLMASTYAQGATPLLFGENGGILTQPYYVDYTPLRQEERNLLTSYTDFSIQYCQLLFGNDLVDVTESFAFGENREFEFSIPPQENTDLSEIGISFEGLPDTLWPIVHMDKKLIVINLINLIGQKDSLWNLEKEPLDKEAGITIQIPPYSPSMHFFMASPQIDNGRAHKLLGRQAEGLRGMAWEITIDALPVWTLVWAEL
ncbi:hypothetical protein SpiGrapes_2566 [Sphaerochaeta pleomorpha str. Grapes]|uniref:Dextranase n=1 Tax=Sphaerochaeta pleomorpha (strain ATCC BAA-1885 / DSM 22778 / Grapes) TaxID=158190 RepID=G8QUL9_SPHPG|nr:glycoside hydrolase family 66 protein [Sphaerochaeta pleomorpha]AEV30327.1 hypothetical protein SpiGrapes_2566 [Sphaerochaeta pleomorpha str. Grapes]